MLAGLMNVFINSSGVADCSLRVEKLLRVSRCVRFNKIPSEFLWSSELNLKRNYRDFHYLLRYSSILESCLQSPKESDNYYEFVNSILKPCFRRKHDKYC